MNNTAGDFTATINWGDGSPLDTTGVVTVQGGTITVSGTHTYASAGQDPVTVTLTDDAPGTASATANSTAFVGAALTGQATITATEGVPLVAGIQVATFTSSNLTDAAPAFSAIIDWGDGTPTSMGAISGSDGSFAIATTAAHTYVDEGAVPATVTVTRTADGAQTALTGPTFVTDAD